jgi:hypothetical protein
MSTPDTTPPRSALGPARLEDLGVPYLRALQADERAITRADIEARVGRAPAISSTELPLPRVRPAGEPDGWRSRSNCAGLDPGVFYPGWDDRAGQAAAKAICAGCVVQPQCLTSALEHYERWGVWGGTNERERRRLVRSLPRVARCRGCGGRYVRTAAGQAYCGECPGMSGKGRAVAS